MSILVAYATKHGATGEIAERIAERITAAGQPAEARPVRKAGDLTAYHGFVIGSATYMGHWRKDATALVMDHRDLLAQRPVWLFSSGPLGSESTDANGRDLGEAAQPKEITELRGAVHPREHKVFWGALDPSRLGFTERAMRKLPAAREIMPEGDFRDWPEIEAWAAGIAEQMAQLRAAPKEAST